MSPSWLRFLVPRDWTGEQALLAASLLRAALDAVWAVHGEEMACVLGTRSRWPQQDDLPNVDDLIQPEDIPY